MPTELERYLQEEGRAEPAGLKALLRTVELPLLTPAVPHGASDEEIDRAIFATGAPGQIVALLLLMQQYDTQRSKSRSVIAKFNAGVDDEHGKKLARRMSHGIVAVGENFGISLSITGEKYTVGDVTPGTCLINPASVPSQPAIVNIGGLIDSAGGLQGGLTIGHGLKFVSGSPPQHFYKYTVAKALARPGR